MTIVGYPILDQAHGAETAATLEAKELERLFLVPALDASLPVALRERSVDEDGSASSLFLRLQLE